jgi:prophage regulatory protein
MSAPGPYALPSGVRTFDKPFLSETDKNRKPSVIIRRPQVEAMTGLSRSTIYARIAAGAFPRQVFLGGKAVGWIEAEILAWIESRIAARDLGGARE